MSSDFKCPAPAAKEILRWRFMFPTGLRWTLIVRKKKHIYVKISELKNKSYVRENKYTNVKTEHMKIWKNNLYQARYYIVLIKQFISGWLFIFPICVQNDKTTHNVFISPPENTFS